VAKKGRKYLEAKRRVDKFNLYSPEEALRLVKELSYAKFDETIETHLRMGVDPRHADQQVRGVVVLPHGTGRQTRILVFAEGEAEKIAEEAGADYVGLDDLVKKIQGGWFDFDVAIAIPPVMGKVGRLGRMLGPRGLMPSPKSNTVVRQEDLARTIEEARKGRVEFRVDRLANMHVPVGKVSFSVEHLLENLGALMEAIVAARPPAVKGQYIRRITLASTMGPGVRMDTTQAMALQYA
jgi:large subunit ribosomal protein L1